MSRTLILSSSSPARRSLLERLQLPFIVSAPHVDETPLANEPISTMVLRLAELKAKKSAALFSDALIIGCDQVGIIHNTLLTKPLTHEKAVEQLHVVSGEKVRFFTGLCLFDAKTHALQSSIATYDVYFHQLTNDMIENYLRLEKPYQCAGSFHAEGLGIALIEKFAGEDFTALIGLPLIQLVSMLKKAGLHPLKTQTHYLP